MNDLTLQKARAYEAEHGAAISPAERPAYHMTPYVGWLNDPNGFSYYKGKYHQFYQYNPYDVRWAPMHWGHAVSTDLLHWEYLPCALAPDSPADNGPGCFSGSATVMDDGKQLLMYTSVVAEKQPNGEMRDIQTQSIAIGDGLNYEKPACNPVLTQKDLPEGFSKFDFRDPKIWREVDGTYSAVTVCRAEDGSGAAALFQSKDGFARPYGDAAQGRVPQRSQRDCLHRQLRPSHPHLHERKCAADGRRHRLLRHPDHPCPGWPPDHDRMAADLVGHQR